MNDEPPVDIGLLVAQELTGFDPTQRGGSSIPIGGVVINWRTLTTEDAQVAWEKLRSFVEWVTVRYDIPLSVIPNCWYRHPALVEELSALHTAHTASFDVSDAGYGPISWHERFATALPRISKAYGGGCTRGHDGLEPRSWEGAIDETEWDTWVQDTHVHRGESAPQREEKQ